MESSNSSSITATDLSWHLLEKVTNGFSEMLGNGAYGEVFKGMYNGEDIAVKKLYHQPGIDDRQFRNEFNNLMKVHHKNIVRLVGYCYEIKHKHIDNNGEYVFGKMVERVLCFEYLPASLDKHLYEESYGHDWCTRYEIIKGISEGLNYLHRGLKIPMFHLDLKPANILLTKNMEAIIGDFGLSRLFGGKQTHITKSWKGTGEYVPPEYLEKHQISEKYDVFSLGVIIIQIMAGPEGYSKYADMPSSQQFIEIVCKNWRERIEATPINTEVDCEQLRNIHCQQVKKCIEIAMNCVERDKGKRPTVGDIVLELKGREHKTSHEARLAKFGPWGGSGGRAREIKAAPRRLRSVTIYYAVIIDSLTFSYIDHSGHQHTVGPWGGSGGSVYTIHLGPLEFLVDISGTIGSFLNGSANVVTSLAFVTNERSYGPFGEGGGTHFRTPTGTDGSIVGFFGHSGWYLDAIGVYVNPNHPTLDREEVIPEESETMRRENNMAEAGFTKFGPWGRIGVMEQDITVVPHRLESLTICSGIVVDSLAFSYSQVNGQIHNIGPWGRPSGTSKTIRLGAYEFLMGISGTVGPSDALDEVITSVKFVTNARAYGPFGQGGGTPFEVPMKYTGHIVGFFGQAELCVEALGVYIHTF